MTRAPIILVVLAGLALSALCAGAPAARAASFSGVCGLPGVVRTGGSPCPARLRTVRPGRSPVRIGGPVAPAGRQRSDFSIPIVGSIFHSIAGKALSTIVSWVAGGAAAALRFTADLVSETTEPELGSSWFSASYWRVAEMAALLTLPFLCAAAVHALLRSDPGLLARAAFGYLPLAMLAIAIAGPVTTLLLSATDEMSAFVAAASGHADSTFLARAASAVSTGSIIDQDPFLAFFVALVTVAATVSLWVELVIRAAAVDVIVLMLPLFFAAMVWPARRVWAIRAVETLCALILAKFAIVSVLVLGGAAIAHAPADGPVAMLQGATLVMLAVLTPWALLRILPIHELAAAAVGGLSAGPRATVQGAGRMLTDELRRGGGGGGETPPNPTGDPDGDVPRLLAARAQDGGYQRGRGPEDGGLTTPLPNDTTEGLASIAAAGSRANVSPSAGDGAAETTAGDGPAGVGTASGGDTGGPRGPLPPQLEKRERPPLVLGPSIAEVPSDPHDAGDGHDGRGGTAE